MVLIIINNSAVFHFQLLIVVPATVNCCQSKLYIPIVSQSQYPPMIISTPGSVQRVYRPKEPYHPTILDAP